VMGVPDSGLDAALGFAQKSGIPYNPGLVKNKYVGRSFIAPDQGMRRLLVRQKLSVIESVVRGKRIVLIDDSIVRGTTSSYIVGLLRDAGAAEVHMRISAPPFLHPCYYGTDVDSEGSLIAQGHTPEQIAEMIGADSVAFLTVEQAIALAGGRGVCTACFDGEYPAGTPKKAEKDRFEISGK
ncbi:MAG: amidophosphoribosyltransferase, partial [Lachnospiraceae bacterium]|nr:amidophosphoribosyltransferase [Lachnospiraceae bacterium]